MAGIEGYNYNTREFQAGYYYDDVMDADHTRSSSAQARRIRTSGEGTYERERYASRGQGLSPTMQQQYRHETLNLTFGQNNVSSSAHSSPAEEDPDSSRFTLYKSVGLISVVADNLLSHPFLVFRRQCQVHVHSKSYHMSPFSLVRPVFHICQWQGASVLWKGLGSSLLVRGMTMAIEDVTSKVTPWPKFAPYTYLMKFIYHRFPKKSTGFQSHPYKEISRHSSLKSVCQHILLKSLSLALITPFYSASLVESCQSEVASETAGFFDVFREGLWRVLSWPQTGRLVPLHVLVIPTVAHGILSYLIYTGIRSISLATIKRVRENKERKQGALYKDSSVSYYSEMSASLVGHMVADILLFPLETVLHRLHLQGTRTIIDSLDCGIEVTPIITSYGGVLDCLRTTVEEEGCSGLYKGLGALIMQYGLQILIIRTIKIILEQTTFGQSSISVKPQEEKGMSMSQSVSEPGNLNKTAYESPIARPPSQQFPRDYSSTSAHGTPHAEPKIRSRLSSYNPSDF